MESIRTTRFGMAESDLIVGFQGNQTLAAISVPKWIA
jgi:hypothetical protein